MVTEHFPFSGWPNNLRLVNDQIEVVILRDVGPRVISLRPLAGRNVFKVLPAQAGKSGEATWMLRGGHRFWTAPEDYGDPNGLDYVPDNGPVEYEIDSDFAVRVTFVIQKPAQIRKDIFVRLAPTGPRVTVDHWLTNQGKTSLRFAPWALSVMAPEGYAIIPQPPLGSHPKDFSPDRVLTLWPFTDLADDRLRFGRRFVQLRQDKRPPFKLGLRHAEGWVGYVLGDHLFLKTIPFVQGNEYPDMGVNFETFTNEDFLEVESLGPYSEILPGETIKHTEDWAVFAGVQLPDFHDQDGLAAAIDPYCRQFL